MTQRIAIIGGGLGGLATALFLAKAGIKATVYEQSGQLTEVGAGIVVPPNMVRLLDHLGLSKSLREFAVQLDAGWEFRRWQNGQVLFVQAMGETCQQLYGAHCYVAHRADLLAMLEQSLARDSIQAGWRCTGIDETLRHVGLTFEDRQGQQHRTEADIVIGADGIHSVVRAAVTAQVDPVFSGLCAFRCLVPAEQAPEMALRPVQTLWLGPGRHFVHYPISGGRLINVVAIVPAGDWRTESWTEDGKISDLANEFAGWDERLNQLIDCATDTKRWALYDRAPLAQWVTSRVALMGDAAHAMLPFFAQGAAQAVEDAAVLARCLSEASIKETARALDRYQQIRQPRASEVQVMSRGRDKRNHLADGPEQMERDAQFANGDPLRQSAWLYGYDALNPGALKSTGT